MSRSDNDFFETQSCRAIIAYRPSVKFRRVRAVQFSDHVLHVAMQSDSRIEQHCYGSPSTTKSSQRATNVDWKKRMPLELQKMQEQASSHRTDLLAMLQPLTPWFVRATASSSERQCRAQTKLTRPPVPLAFASFETSIPGLSPRPNLLHERK